jgi:hypothetical protein
MPIEKIPNSDIEYYLLAYDKKGQERQDDPHAGASGLLSEKVEDELRDQPITDVFFISHGWKGDVPAAKEQYVNWIGAMIACEEDWEKIRQVRTNFRPLLIGLHWPSLPWGDEDLDVSALSFTVGEDPIADLVDDVADKIVDTAPARQALRTIFEAAMDDISPSTLPPKVVDAYKLLQEEAGLSGDGPGASPGADAEKFDPEQSYQSETQEVSFGNSSFGGLLSPLQQLSFWAMKARAKDFGERGAGNLLRKLQHIVEDRDTRFHLMGHSFGCIVVSATVAGTGGNSPLIQPVHSMFLVQGALSLWSYCSDIPVVAGKSGYFHSIIGDNKVSGPIVSTQSEHDTAVGLLYPLAAGAKEQVVFALGELPKYGAVGAYGIRGPEVTIVDMEMLSIDKRYGFEKGKCYNLESSKIIRNGGGVSGAHSDIAHPEVAHAFWEAVIG